MFLHILQIVVIFIVILLLLASLLLPRKILEKLGYGKKKESIFIKILQIPLVNQELNNLDQSNKLDNMVKALDNSKVFKSNFKMLVHNTEYENLKQVLVSSGVKITDIQLIELIRFFKGFKV